MVPSLLEYGVSDGSAPDVFLAVPSQGSHAFLLHPAKVQWPALPGMLWTEGQVSAGVVCRTQNSQTGASLITFLGMVPQGTSAQGLLTSIS